MNTALLERVKAHILEEARDERGPFKVGPFKVPPRASMALIPRTICLLAGKRTSSYERAARKLLAITPDDAIKLFYAFAWPNDLRRRYDRAMNRGEVAQVIAERIDRFIEEHQG